MSVQRVFPNCTRAPHSSARRGAERGAGSGGFGRRGEKAPTRDSPWSGERSGGVEEEEEEEDIEKS